MAGICANTFAYSIQTEQFGGFAPAPELEIRAADFQQTIDPTCYPMSSKAVGLEEPVGFLAGTTRWWLTLGAGLAIGWLLLEPVQKTVKKYA